MHMLVLFLTMNYHCMVRNHLKLCVCVCSLNSASCNDDTGIWRYSYKHP